MSGTTLYSGGGNYEIKDKDLRTGKLEGITGAGGDDGNMLQLEVRDSLRFEGVKGGSPMGMFLGPKGGRKGGLGGLGGLGGKGTGGVVSESHIGLSQMQEELLRSGEIRGAQPPLELVLDPEPPRRRVPGGSPMGFTPQSGPSSGVRGGWDGGMAGSGSGSGSGKYLVNSGKGMELYREPDGGGGGGDSVSNGNDNTSSNPTVNSVSSGSGSGTNRSKKNGNNDGSSDSNDNTHNRKDDTSNNKNDVNDNGMRNPINKKNIIITDIATRVKNQNNVFEQQNRETNSTRGDETESAKTYDQERTSSDTQTVRNREITSNVKDEREVGGDAMLKNSSRVRFSVEVETDAKTNHKNAKNLQKKLKNNKYDNQNDKNNLKKTVKNENDKLRSSSSIMAGVSNSIRAKKEKEEESGVQAQQDNRAENLQKKKIQEYDPGSDPRASLEAPRLSVPVGLGPAPPSFSPARISKLGEQLDSLNVH